MNVPAMNSYIHIYMLLFSSGPTLRCGEHAELHTLLYGWRAAVKTAWGKALEELL
jgi:hypothetical protein